MEHMKRSRGTTVYVLWNERRTKFFVGMSRAFSHDFHSTWLTVYGPWEVKCSVYLAHGDPTLLAYRRAAELMLEHGVNAVRCVFFSKSEPFTTLDLDELVDFIATHAKRAPQRVRAAIEHGVDPPPIGLQSVRERVRERVRDNARAHALDDIRRVSAPSSMHPHALDHIKESRASDAVHTGTIHASF